MSTLPALDDADLREQVSPESYRRGEPYFERGAIQDPRRSGGRLRALCEGSRAEPYRVSMQLGAHKIAWAHCTCPVGAQGRCKHVAALLFAWVRAPETFAEVEELEAALQARPVEQLRAMLRYVIRRHPELEPVIQMRFPVGEDGGGDLDPEIYREQARAVFREHARGLGSTSQISDALRPLVEIVDGFRARSSWLAAARITRALVDEIADQLPHFTDGERFLDELLEELVLTLEEALRQRDAPRPARHEILGALARLAPLEAAPGARARAERLALGEALDPEDRRELAAHLRQHLRQRQRDGDIDSWLLLQLEAPSIDEEAFITRCRALGRRDALVRHLLERERVDDALAEIIEIERDEHFLGLVEAFAERGWSAEVEPLVRQRYEQSGDLRLLGWLEARYRERGEDALAMAAAMTRFWRQPSMAALEQVRGLSQPRGQWEVMRPSLLAHLRDQGAWSVLVRAHLLEERVDEAADALADARRHGYLGPEDLIELELELAEVARQPRPHLAQRLYREIAEHYIERRSLASFKHAASALARARGVAEDLSELEEWERYRAELLDRYGRFEGLRDALRVAGLMV